MSNENELLEKKGLREKVINRTDVLDKVKELILLPNTEYATTEQVAEYYEVTYQTIETIVSRHRGELESDGFKNFKKGSVIKMLNIQNECLENKIGKSVAVLDNDNKLEIPNRGLRLFPRRAILRVGMLLRDSEVAKEVRTRLLDIIHDAEKENPEIIQNVVNEIDEEKQLMLDRIKAEMDGNFDEVCVINAKLFALKNKRIKELETDIENISTHALTIMESRSVINRIVRTIAKKKYNNMFGRAYGDLYSKVNYKLGINIKARDKKKSESYLNTLTEEETFEVEKIVRNWAVKVGLDLEELLKIA